MPLCTLCPRNCRVDRSKTTGVCSVKGLRLAKASLHFGEEPCISGTDGKGAGTIFFSGCSLKCIFCQNMPISRDGYGKEISPERLGEIMLELQEKGAHNINLVTPTHYADVIAGVLEKIRPQLEIPVVYNCGGYEKVETLKMLDGLIDIYLPDFQVCPRRILPVSIPPLRIIRIQRLRRSPKCTARREMSGSMRTD